MQLKVCRTPALQPDLFLTPDMIGPCDPSITIPLFALAVGATGNLQAEEVYERMMEFAKKRGEISEQTCCPQSRKWKAWLCVCCMCVCVRVHVWVCLHAWMCLGRVFVLHQTLCVSFNKPNTLCMYVCICMCMCMCVYTVQYVYVCVHCMCVCAFVILLLSLLPSPSLSPSPALLPLTLPCPPPSNPPPVLLPLTLPLPSSL